MRHLDFKQIACHAIGFVIGFSACLASRIAFSANCNDAFLPLARMGASTPASAMVQSTSASAPVVPITPAPTAPAAPIAPTALSTTSTTASAPSSEQDHCDVGFVCLDHAVYMMQDVTTLWSRVVNPGIQRSRDVEKMLAEVVQRTSLRGEDDFPIVVAVYDFMQWLDKYSLRTPARLLHFEPRDHELSLLQPADRVVYQSDGQDKNDIHRLDASILQGGAGFDMVLLGQALEHLYDPFLAVSKIKNVMKDGGYLFARAPLVSIPHMTPNHFYHFTEIGLAMLMQRVGFEVLEVGKWGSMEYEKQLFGHMSWPGLDKLQNKAGDPKHVDQVWALVRKPLNPDALKSLTRPSVRLMHPAWQYRNVDTLWNSVVRPGSQRTYNPADVVEVVTRRTVLRGGNDFPRVVAVYDFIQWVDKYKLHTPTRLLQFGRQDYELPLVKPLSNVIYEFDGGDNQDLHKLSTSIWKDGPPFDMVILGQTLEHLYDPFLAMSNVKNVMKDGGYFFTSTPTTNIPHMTPSHFYHYTEMGLAALMRRVGFEVLEVGKWGSAEYEEYLFGHMWWPGWDKLQNRAGDPAHLDQVWALVRK